MSATELLPVLVEKIDAVGVVTFNRPEKRNALDLTMRSAIAESVSELAKDPAVAAIVLTGGPEIFAAGADLNLLVDKGSQEVADIDLGQYWAPVRYCDKPILAAVNGFALGAGCELAMMCDVIVADRSAQFGQPEARVGIMPGAGGTQRLIRAVGKATASMMLMCGENISAERALQAGLISDMTDQAQALPRALELAKAASRMPAKSLLAIKRCLNEGADLSLDAALMLENREFLLLFDTHDKCEGMQAFLEKRRPQFQGK